MFTKLLLASLLVLAVTAEEKPSGEKDDKNVQHGGKVPNSAFFRSVAAFLASYANKENNDKEKSHQRSSLNSGWLKTVSAPPYSSSDLDTLSQELYRLDQQGNAASINVHWTVNTRSTNGKLFTKLDKTIFDKPTYKKLISLFDNYEPKLGVAENVTPQKLDEQSAFLDSIIATPVMQKALEFLQKRFPDTISKSTFKTFLQRIWFTIYRRKGAPDTSGFEHVFVGETNENNEVEGFHNWVKYAIDESNGAVKYGRWKGQANPDLYGMQFTWNGLTKIKSTIAIGESPEMSFAILTTCFMMAPNSGCNMKMGDAVVNIQSFKWDNRANSDYYVASAYYDNQPPAPGRK